MCGRRSSTHSDVERNTKGDVSVKPSTATAPSASSSNCLGFILLSVMRCSLAAGEGPGRVDVTDLAGHGDGKALAWGSSR